MTDGTSNTTVSADAECFASRLRAQLSELAASEGGHWIARAAGTLDVMGGIAEHTGALTLAAPTSHAVLAAVLPRADQRLRVVSLGEPGNPSRDNGRWTQVEWALSAFYDVDGAVLPPRAVRDLGKQIGCETKLAALSVAYVLLQSKVASHLKGGVTIVIEPGIPGSVDCRQVASIQAAVLGALTRCLGLELGARRLAILCQQAHGMVMGRPSGIATHSAPVMGVPGCLLPVCCRSFEPGETLAMPRGVTVLGIDCGVRHEAADEKHAQVRTTALMGREIIRQLLRTAGDEACVWDGCLARVSITDYVDRLRDRLPTKLTGALFLERFGELADELAPIDPAACYKVRSRTEHHIYEDSRVRQFAERLVRAARTSERRTLLGAGEQMYASHWSYGQRCGLGSIETDLLVNLLRAEGADRGIFGARISGPGAGGTVVVLMSDTAEAHKAVNRAVATYQEQTGYGACLLPLATEGPPALTVERCA